MTRYPDSKCLLGRFRRSRGGNILIITALMATVLVYAVGVAVDYMDAVNFRTTLQNTVDTAALAGATAYVTCASSGAGSAANAQTIATNVFNATALPWHNGSITPTATASTTAGTGYSVCSGGSGNPSAYQMTVSASGTVPTTFLAVIQPSMSVSATATATNPVVTANINAGGWGSSAGDGNYIYVYKIPADGTVPYFDYANSGIAANPTSPNTTVGPFQLLYSNLFSSNGSNTLTIAASQKLGFMMVNVNEGRGCYGGGSGVLNGGTCAATVSGGGATIYNSGQYASASSSSNQAAGSVHEFYSQNAIPNADTTTVDETGSSPVTHAHGNNGYTGNYDVNGTNGVGGTHPDNYGLTGDSTSTCNTYNGSSVCGMLQSCKYTTNGVTTTYAEGSNQCKAVQNCSLQTVTTFADGTAVTPTSIGNLSFTTNSHGQYTGSHGDPTSGSCYGTSAQPYTSESCQQLNGQAVYYEWNDMGWYYDDYDYNDAMYGIYCSGANGVSGNSYVGAVHLIN
jgi:Flp pilus assembly protein TadG